MKRICISYIQTVYTLENITQQKKEKRGGGEEREKERGTQGGVLTHGRHTFLFNKYII